MEQPSSFPARLNRLRKERGISQEELAGVVGVSRQAVQKWESGVSRPDMDNLTALSDYFGVSLDYLIRGIESSGAGPQTGGTSHPGGDAWGDHDEDPRRFPEAEPWEDTPRGRRRTSGGWGWGWHYEYQSRRTLFGLPLVHINLGPGHGRTRRARGIVAVGNSAVGLVAVGFASVGLIAAGFASVGLLALGALCVGLLLALGGVAVGGVALGGLAVGWLAFGGLAVGAYAMGGLAVGGCVAAGGGAVGHIAIGSPELCEGEIRFLLTKNGPDQSAAIYASIRQTFPNLPGWLATLFSAAG